MSREINITEQELTQFLTELKKMGYEIAMITGENEDTAQSVGGKIGIDIVMARVLPHKKSNMYVS